MKKESQCNHNGSKSGESKKRSRELYLFSEINAETVQDLVKNLRELDKDRAKRPIHLLLHSPGGEMSSGFALIDTILQCRCPVYTYALGEICSMAPAIFVTGKKRFIAAHTYVMLHPCSIGAVDYTEFAKSRIRNAEAAEKMFDAYFLTRTKMPKKLYMQSKYKEIWLTPEETIKYGIATELVKGE